MLTLTAFAIGFALDALIGDPIRWPHLVIGMGKAVTAGEKIQRRIFPKTPAGEFTGGLILAAALPVLFCGITWALLYACRRVHPAVAVAVESILIWQCLSTRSLYCAGMTVFSALEKGDLPGARRAVGGFVGRDTDRLDLGGVTRAAVETVAENTTDGVVAPMLFIALGGAPLGVFYKMVNTMDSMIGYRSDVYQHFGRAAARLDDAVNFIPARIAGMLTAASAFFTKLDGRNAWRIYLRDRRNHKSPNSAQTEAACAGALHVRLGGDARYFGYLVKKPAVGDDDRPVEPEDIRRAGRLMIWTACFFFLLCILARGAFLCL